MSAAAQTVTGMLVALALVPLVWWGMLRGWRARAARQVGDLGLPTPTGVDDLDADALTDPVPGGVEGVYVSTTLAGQPLERVTAHGLGARSALRAGVTGDALVLHRPGARSLTIPGRDVVAVRTTRGQAGKYTLEKDGVVVVTWRLGDVELDTGLRARRRAEGRALIDAVRDLAHGAPAAGPEHLGDPAAGAGDLAAGAGDPAAGAASSRSGAQ